ncbi:hypothetical protein BWI17_14125 [Betaproteobacteria bacterium GR16-43]|nr:hypothetical protein BWI17_14125 [Betaproteobacteria bacterium GR16-43]
MADTVQVLLVEDSENDALLLAIELERLEGGVRIVRVQASDTLEAALNAQAWDIVISDFNMPAFSGLAALEIVRRRSPDLPFLLVSATVGEDIAVQAMRSGANDYIMKGKLARLLPAVQRELREAANRRDQRERLHYLAYFDATTGLANRALFAERVGQLLNAARRDRQRLAVAVLDLDQLKSINASLGRQAGDTLLAQAAVRLSGSTPDPDHLARTEADQFAIVIPEFRSETELARVDLERLRACFDAPFTLNGGDVQVIARSGIALFPADGKDADVLLRNAEAAAVRAKTAREPYLFYAETMTRRVSERLTLETRMRGALERNEFVLQYQPKVNLATRRIVGVEALIRWNNAEGSLVLPGHFIPLLEETGMIAEVGQWALQQAVRDYQAWVAEGVVAPRIAVNVSVVQIHRADFVDVVREAVRPLGAAPPIDLEITESLLAGDVEGSIAKLEAVRALGVGLAIDDFGTGFSSLAYLAKLPVQQIKIDRSFIVGMMRDSHAMTLVTTIVTLAKSLGLVAIAEGVETEDQARLLSTAGCHQVQGYLTGRPMPREMVTPLLEPTGIVRRDQGERRRPA